MAENSGQQGEFITLEVAARLLMLSTERIRQLNKAGFIPMPKRGMTTIVGAVQGYIRYLRDEANKTSKSKAAEEAVSARAEEIRIKIAERKRDLIPIEEATLAMDLLVGRVVREMDGAAARITRDMTLRRQIEADTHGAKTRIADYLGTVKEFAATGREPDAALGGDDA